MASQREAVGHETLEKVPSPDPGSLAWRDHCLEVSAEAVDPAKAVTKPELAATRRAVRAIVVRARPASLFRPLPRTSDPPLFFRAFFSKHFELLFKA
jgi:hypothetical protein